MAADFRDKKIEEIIRELAAKFLLEESSGKTMITVTKAELSSDGKSVTVYFTVFPDDGEENALNFAKRKRTEFKHYIQDKSRLVRIPFVDFEIDLGEKNRQHIDSIGYRIQKES